MESLKLDLDVKKCFKCLEILSICEFYKHRTMSDGYTNKCKKCTINDVRYRESVLRKSNPIWVENEKKRHRELYSLLNCSWSDVDEFDNYLISDTGLIKNKKSGRFLKPYLNSHGYYCLSMWNKGIQ